MVSTTFSLEHFYYGQLVHRGQPQGAARLLAKSSGVTDDLVSAAVKQVALPPAPGTLAWSITRGRQITPLMAQAQQGRFGQATWHYVVMPPETLRVMGGDLTALMALVEEELPVFEMLGDPLPPLSLSEAAPPSTEAQINAILELMTFARNRMQTMEALLSAIVQGVQLVIVGAPPVLRQRVQFIEGLLALLPPSTRFGITFATHTLSTTQLDVQIRFLDDDNPPRETLVYNWADAGVSGREVEDEYSHFIISQLRLDAELVIQQTQTLTAVAGWRVRQGDRLRDALAYASKRRKLDEALLHNQPVEIADVARTLAEDPTLSDDLRLAYARHLLTFSLALGEIEHADPLAAQLRANPDLAQAALQELDDAIREGRAGPVFDLLARWMADPLGPQGAEWVTLAHKAALLRLGEQVKTQDLEGVRTFIFTLLDADPGVFVRRIVPKVIEVLMPLTARDPALAANLFVLAASYLDAAELARLLDTPAFVARLPKQVAAFLPYVSGQAEVAPTGALVNVARMFDEEWQPVIALRLAELALVHGRIDLLDTPSLGVILKAALSPRSAEYGGLLLSIVEGFSGPALGGLADPGPRYLLQILLALGEYHMLAREMIRHAREIYPGDLQEKYIAAAYHIFAETPLPPEKALAAVQAIRDEGIKAVPFAVAEMGALAASDWSPDLEPVGDDVVRTLFENPKYLEVMYPEAMIALLTYYTKQGDVPGAIRVAGLVSTAAAYQETGGLETITRMYKLMDWEARVRLAALELLRRYVRKAEDKDARQAVVHFGRELGPAVRRSLEVTYTFKRFMAGRDISAYAARVHAVAEFLQDTAAAYAGRDTPNPGALVDALEGMTGSIDRDERRAVGEHLLAAGRAIVALGRQARSSSPRNLDAHIDQVLAGESDPLSALDVFRAMGGYFARGRRFNLKLEPLANPFRDRSVPHLQEDIEFTHEVLAGAVQAFPADRPVKLAASEVREELDSIWGEVSAEQQRMLVRNLAIDLQRIPDLAAIIAERGDPKALEEGSLGEKLDTGRQRPRSTLEFYRFLYGYWRWGR